MGFTLGVCDLTLPARASEPWTLPMIAVRARWSRGAFRWLATSGECRELAKCPPAIRVQAIQTESVQADSRYGITRHYILFIELKLSADFGVVVDVGVAEMWFVARSLRTI